MRFQQSVMWDRYRDWVRAGWQGTPLEQCNGLQQIKQLYSGIPALWRGVQLWDERTATVLDMIPPIRFIHPNAPEPELHTCHPTESIAPDTVRYALRSSERPTRKNGNNARRNITASTAGRCRHRGRRGGRDAHRRC